MITKRISLLRAWMREQHLDAFIIPSADPHAGEYVAPLWKSREWITGFTGSAGTAVVTLEEAGLWTDSRYFIQAEQQLQGSGVVLHRSYQSELTGEIPTWLAKRLVMGNSVGVDATLLTKAQADAIYAALAPKNILLVPCGDPFAEIWEDRPSLPMSHAECYPKEYTGESAAERLTLLRRELNALEADTLFVTPLDETAWTLHVRADDVTYTPVLISYMLVEADRATLFVHPDKCPQPVCDYLRSEGVSVAPYDEAFTALGKLTGRRILLPATKTSWAAFEAVDKDQNTILTAPSPLSWMKAVRTQAERDGLRQCMIQDGTAMVRFQKWLLEALAGGETVTEMSLDERLYAFRAEQPLFKDASFATIAGYGANAASPHYQATPETDTTLQPRGYILLDSGGQYLNGTTDITRTIVLGPLTEEEKTDYTLVLRGHINLSMAKFPKGTNGNQLDVLARMPLWECGLQYLHGTGHGVGHYLSVHEATDVYQFRMSGASAPLMLHTTITNEPALYKAGSHGCRTENQLLIVHDQTTAFGEFYRFEPLTLCPIDTEAIDLSLMHPHEIHWLNAYHQQVFEKLSPHLTPEERDWLCTRCRKIDV